MRIPFHKKRSSVLKGYDSDTSSVTSSVSNVSLGNSSLGNSSHSNGSRQRRQGVMEDNKERVEQFQGLFKDFVLPKQRRVGVVHEDETKRRDLTKKLLKSLRSECSLSNEGVVDSSGRKIVVFEEDKKQKEDIVKKLEDDMRREFLLKYCIL